MMADKSFSLGRVPLVWIVIGTALAVSALVFLAAEVTHGQTPIPTITGVDPAPPYCVLQRSSEDTNRLLTITGEGLTAFGNDGRLQFRDERSRSQTELFSRQINWQDPRRISIDMSQVDLRFDSDGQLRLQVRVISDESEELVSAWSEEFIFAQDRRGCGTDARFPPTSPIRGLEGDLWADVIIGKPDFSQIAPKSVVPFKVYNPTGVLVDRSVEPGRAYVWDSGNSRVLGIDLGKCNEIDGACSADIIIGQPSGYDHSACNGDDGVQNFPMRASPTAKTLCGNPDHSLSPWEAYSFVTMAVDSDSSLFLPDFFNHRILKYENPFETDSVADQVWGQADFSGMVCNRGRLDRPTAESLCFQSDSVRLALNHYGAGVEIDAEGNMWVADVGNNRVLRFPVNSATGEIAQRADLVLGQSGFRTGAPGRSMRQFHAPSAVRFDSNGWLYVADAANSRVLVFEPPFESGTAADMTFGSQLHHPTSLEIDPLDRGVWIVDARNYMVELWDKTGTSVLKVLGKNSYQPDGMCGHPLAGVPGRTRFCPIGGSIGIDGHGNVLVPVYHNAADVFRFPTAPERLLTTQGVDPDRRLFYPPFEDNLRDNRGIHSARGVATWGDQLIVSDIRRLMFWNGLEALTNGQPADGVIGDESAVGEWHYCCGRIKTDDAGKLWVLAFEGIHFIDVYQLPLSEYAVPLHTVWKDQATFPVLGTEERLSLGHSIDGIAPVGKGEFLWLSDTDNHRVVRIRNPLTDPVVDVVLGQTDAETTECNKGRFPAAGKPDTENRRNLDVLCFPGALSIDNEGNLYVSDHALEVEGNRRLLIFSRESLPTDNVQPIFSPSATKVFSRAVEGLTSLWADPWEPHEIFGKYDGRTRGYLAAATWETAFDSTNRMVVGYNAYAGPRFVGVYDDPLGLDTLPSSFLYDFASMPYTATFDENDNLYVGDINRGRVLVYKNPFGNTSAAEVQQPDISDSPLPSYAVSIRSIHPEPPYCLFRESLRDYERTLELELEGLEDIRGLTLEFRKVGSRHREFLDLRSEFLRNDDSSIRLNQRDLWQGLWSHLDTDRVVLTVRILEGGVDGTPISNWSPAFVLADDASACGIALPTPTPIPTATPTETPTPSPTPIPTNTATPTVTPTPMPSPTPTPAETPVSATEENPTSTPDASTEPAGTPTAESASGIGFGQGLAIAVIGILAAAIGILVWKRRR